MVTRIDTENSCVYLGSGAYSRILSGRASDMTETRCLDPETSRYNVQHVPGPVSIYPRHGKKTRTRESEMHNVNRPDAI